MSSKSSASMHTHGSMFSRTQKDNCRQTCLTFIKRLKETLNWYKKIVENFPHSHTMNKSYRNRGKKQSLIRRQEVWKKLKRQLIFSSNYQQARKEIQSENAERNFLMILVEAHSALCKTKKTLRVKEHLEMLKIWLQIKIK